MENQAQILTQAVSSLVQLAHRLGVNVSDLSSQIDAVLSFSRPSIAIQIQDPVKCSSEHLRTSSDSAAPKEGSPTTRSVLLPQPLGEGTVEQATLLTPHRSPTSTAVAEAKSVSLVDSDSRNASWPASAKRTPPTASPESTSSPFPPQGAVASASASVPTTVDASPPALPSHFRHSLSVGNSPAASSSRSRYLTMQHDKTPPSLAAAMGAAASRPLVARASSSNLLIPPASSGGGSSVRSGAVVARVPNSGAASTSAAVSAPSAATAPARPALSSAAPKDSGKSGPQRVAVTAVPPVTGPGVRSQLQHGALGMRGGSAGSAASSSALGGPQHIRRGSGGPATGGTLSSTGGLGQGFGGVATLKQPPRRV
jgi:hypothetical protein